MSKQKKASREATTTTGQSLSTALMALPETVRSVVGNDIALRLERVAADYQRATGNDAVLPLDKANALHAALIECEPHVSKLEDLLHEDA